jgi:hydroxyethylthiazole kinase-like uncharacterized protein yjeF
LSDSAASRALEQAVAAQLPPHALMQRAGLAIARSAMAMAPHARVIWIPCGPGNNGGDGFEAARHLHTWGKRPVVTCLEPHTQPPADALAARKRALDAGVAFADTPPTSHDLSIDALFGIGITRPFSDRCNSWIQHINDYAAPVLAVDVPSGLHADTGRAADAHVRANCTLSLLTLKPGLFTADGREACGDIWFNSLDVEQSTAPCAYLIGTPNLSTRAHNTHKGSYGDVAVVGGSPGMTGAALLAAHAALHGGAGRVYVGLLDDAAMPLDIGQPELMFRSIHKLDYAGLTVVAGCGGGTAIQAHLPTLLQQAHQLVLDADALNAIAGDPSLQTQLAERTAPTVLTPHPLEAARLLGLQTSSVQANRLAAAQALAHRYTCTVVLKGSGTIVASPHATPRINSSGNARLASAGTGDVLAGLIGARLAAGGDIFQATCEAVYRHGAVADGWLPRSTLTARELARAL